MENLSNKFIPQIPESRSNTPSNRQIDVPDAPKKYFDFFFNDYSSFRYLFHKETKITYLKNYIKKINDFADERKTEFYFDFRFHNFLSSEDGEIYFLTNELHVARLGEDEGIITVIPERREGFILHERPWDETKRTLDSKLVFVRDHPAKATPAPVGHPNYFSYKNSLIVSWDKSLIYFYNLYTKIHAKPVPHKFNILGLALGRFETVIVMDKYDRKLVWYNIFEQTKQIAIDCDFLHPCKMELHGSLLLMESAVKKVSADSNALHLKKTMIFNTQMYKPAFKIEAKSVNVAKHKPLIYYISSSGSLVIKNYLSNMIIEEIKNDFIIEDTFLSQDEKEIYMLAKINHPMQSWIKILCFELKTKRFRLEYDLKYYATNIFVNATKSKILHWNRDVKTVTLEELMIDHSEVLFEFDRPMEKFDFKTNSAYYFHDRTLYKQNLLTYERTPIISRGNHNFQIRGKYYFMYSNSILAIFDSNDKCLFDNYIDLNRRINKLNAEANEPVKEKAEGNEKENRPSQTNQNRDHDSQASQRLENQEESANEDDEGDEEEEQDQFYDGMYSKFSKAKNNKIGSLKRLINESFVDREGKDLMDPNKSLLDRETQRLLNEVNWIYFLDFVDGDPPAFYFINLQNFQLLIFSRVTLDDEPLMIDLKAEIHAGRVTRDRRLFYALLSDNRIKLWDLHTREKLRTFSLTGQSIKLSIDEKKLFILNQTGWLFIVETESDKVLHKILIDPKGTARSHANYFIKENEANPNELYILYNRKIKRHVLLPRINVWEYQFINVFFKPTKMIKAEEFDANIQKYREIYDQSIVLQEYFNPIFIASIYSISSSLQKLFNKGVFKYPSESTLQIKPLLLSLYNKDINIVEIICEHILNSQSSMTYSYEEMCLLMQIDYPFTKMALLKSIQEINPIEFDSEVYEWPQKLKKKLLICFQPDKNFSLESLQLIKDISSGTITNIFKTLPKMFQRRSKPQQGPPLSQIKFNQLQRLPSLNRDDSRFSQKSSNTIKIIKNISSENTKDFNFASSKRIDYFLIKGQFNFHDGSEDSRFFLRHYCKSNQTQFIMSRLRFIVIDKWNRLSLLYKSEAIFFIFMTVFLTLTLFTPENIAFFVITLAFLGVYLCYEGLTYFVEPIEYFRNKDNLLDITSILFGLTLTIISRVFLRVQNYNRDVLTLFQVITLFIFYFRCTTYLKAFDILNPIVTMIYTVTADIWDIIFVLAVLMICFSLLFVKAETDFGFGKLLAINYFSFFGDINTALVADNNYIVWTVTIFATLFITFVMSNFIIARMSNNYTRMEQRQIEVVLKEKARIILEFETFINIFPSYSRKMRKLSKEKYYTLIVNDTNKMINFEEIIEKKFSAKNPLVDLSVEFNQALIEDLVILNAKVDGLEENHKEIAQSLAKHKRV